MRKSKHEVTLEFQVQKTAIWATTVTKIFKYLFSSAATIVAFYFIFLSIDSLSGDDTNARISVVFDIISKRSLATLLPWLLCVGGVTYGLMERRIRIAKTQRLARQNKLLEKNMNASRRSSRLDQSGNARQEDK